MGKRFKNRFCIQFNGIDPNQQFAADILNDLPPRSIAMYIAQAVCAYEDAGQVQIVEKRKRRIPKTNDKTISSSDNGISSISSSHKENIKNPTTNGKDNQATNQEEQDIIIVTNNEGKNNKEIPVDMMESMKDFLGG